MSLEDLREFLQERIAQTFLHSDDVIVEQLQASMTELRKMKLDLPPPGAVPRRLTCAVLVVVLHIVTPLFCSQGSLRSCLVSPWVRSCRCC